MAKKLYKQKYGPAGLQMQDNDPIKVEALRLLRDLLHDQEYNKKKALFGRLATFIDSIGGDEATVKSRKDIISDIVYSNHAPIEVYNSPISYLIQQFQEYVYIAWLSDDNVSYGNVVDMWNPFIEKIIAKDKNYVIEDKEEGTESKG